MSTRRRARYRRVARGFTLVEAIASITVLAVVMTASSSVILGAADSYADAAATARASSDADAAMEFIAGTLRAIPAAGGVGGGPAITAVTAGSITWGGGEALALSGAAVLYTPAGGTATTLIDGVTAFSVRCYDESNGAMAVTLSGSACSTIRRIEVSLTVTSNGASSMLRTRVFPRCMVNGSAP